MKAFLFALAVGAASLVGVGEAKAQYGHGGVVVAKSHCSTPVVSSFGYGGFAAQSNCFGGYCAPVQSSVILANPYSVSPFATYGYGGVSSFNSYVSPFVVRPLVVPHFKSGVRVRTFGGY